MQNTVPASPCSIVIEDSPTESVKQPETLVSKPAEPQVSKPVPNLLLNAPPAKSPINLLAMMKSQTVPVENGKSVETLPKKISGLDLLKQRLGQNLVS